ncbi:LacI family DNA-binding transcriptional regulator [Rhizobium sp. CC-YZS058]|uniref:LacI family DNA-binding transcriptional regulator n=1 Tax=Rhizobium sp. CC-YZS058 TaxID=3042153 RepID=UPI002B0569A9|nr:LacI family DNA-binding transcriptional regulator [Rhizobium sp. CC-YZS058]MEA3537058.1 LacI family DNA-binding transcriptional regulator [Rhizobium sp. CC-YZS058]
MAKKTSLDVAKAAGVSLSTVDRVLNGRGGVSEDKERKVLAAARSLQINRVLDTRAVRTLRIAVFLQSQDNPYHAALQEGFEAANRDGGRYNLRFEIHHIDPPRPAATARLVYAVAGRCDGIVIVSSQDEEIAAALRNFGQSGKPVLTLATDLRNAGRTAYVGPDNRMAGRVAGDLMGRLLGREGGEIVVISGMLSMIGHEEREMGFRAVLRERHPACRIAEVMQSMERSELAGDLVFTALRSNPHVRGIYNVSAGAQPVVDAIRRLNKSRDVVFITHELTEDRRRLMRQGLIDAVLDQDAKLEVDLAIASLAFHFARRDRAPETLITPTRIFMMENA